ncbi:MAG: hypothetical protein EBT27_00220 [Betaproteobacteria bacterium]|nr:hypothetical protein [Betaproteobacteria bacterium]
MGHIDYNKRTRASAPVDPAWLLAGSQAGQLANMLAGRGDIAVRIGSRTSSGAPACFAPLTAEMELDAGVAFGKVDPKRVGNITERNVQFEYAQATGLIFHEALHARFSTWDLPAAHEALTQAEVHALVLLEEGRIEAQGLKMYPDNACFLRACVLGIVMSDLELNPITELTPTRAAAQVLALTSARVDAGSVMFEDIESIERVITKKLGVDLFNKLAELWREAQVTEAHDIEKLYDIARRWAKLVEDAAKDAGEGEMADSFGGAGGGAGGGGTEGEDDPETAGMMEELMKELEEAADNASIGAADDAAEQQQTEEWREEASTRAQSAKRTAENRETAQKVFGKGTGPVADERTSSSLVETRKPRTDERTSAVRLAQLLEKAKYRERDETEVTSVIPPGRLRTRAMVQGAAFKAKGVMTQVEPWRRTVRKHTDDPTLTVGVMVDISGSMSAAMQPMASTAWILSEAVRRVQGRAAMVYYGQGVFPTLKPGQHLSEVNVYTACDGTEKFDQAFKALDGSLNLLNGTGAKMLVVVSDGCYTHDQERAASAWAAQCAASGVAVTWVTFDPTDASPEKIVRKNGVVVRIEPGMTATQDIATHIGRSAAQQLTQVSERR